MVRPAAEVERRPLERRHPALAEKNSLASSVSRPIISVPVSASTIDWVNRRFFTGCAISPFSIRNVPSRVMPVIVDSIGWTTFV